ncbi:hypothetical protein LR3_07985 [Limosilactobacillus reuteri]|uniref:Uncharacterized protein n=1 Tax=Limosilactobacillus reuteri TaxID=1598 RepID=A0A073K2F5_LIMRT|nr:hypothetical protein LR3_07985 [Limosilactobacillus reuteri]
MPGIVKPLHRGEDVQDGKEQGIGEEYDSHDEGECRRIVNIGGQRNIVDQRNDETNDGQAEISPPVISASHALVGVEDRFKPEFC